MSKANLILIGPPGAGKSAIARRLASLLGWAHVDTDLLIEANEAKSIPEIFSEVGEEGFRKIESEVIGGLDGIERTVVATGGGAVLARENRTLLQKLGRMIYLRVSAAEAERRITDGVSRPLLSDTDIADVIAARDPIYADLADEVIDADGDVDLVIRRLAKVVGR